MGARAAFAAVLCLLVPISPAAGQEWGAWHMVGPFDHPGGSGNIDAPQTVEKDLRRLRAGGPGLKPDVKLRGVGGARLEWQILPESESVADVGEISFRELLTPPKQTKRKNWWEHSVVYMYRTITVEEAMQIPLRCGSDDGLRLWLNGELLVDLAVGRALNPSNHILTFNLEAGVNHLLVKVANGGGEWGFQLVQREIGKIDQDAVHAAIDSGVEWLLRTQLLDGSWSAHPEYRAGSTAYAGYCLLKCGVRPEHPAIQRAHAYVLQHPSDFNYSTACELLFLCTLNRAQDRSAIQDRLDRMLDWQASTGLFTYPVHPGGNSLAPDLSLTLYSALAMHACEVYGVEVSDRAWARTLDGALSCFEGVSRSSQARDQGAGFRYHGGRAITGSMTTAGLSVIDLVREGLDGEFPAGSRRRAQTATDAGLAWLHGKMNWHENPGQGGEHHYFWLYGVERVGSLLELDELGGVPWYLDGAEYLIGAQGTNGAWINGVDTILALLFLKRASLRVPAESGKSLDLNRTRWITTDAEASLSLVANLKSEMVVWVQEVHSVERERLAWKDQTLRVQQVEYVATPGEGGAPFQLGVVTADPHQPTDDQRYAAKGTLPEQGEWDIVARMHVLIEPVEEGAEPKVEILESLPLRVYAPDVISPDQLGYAAQGKDNLLAGVEVEINASTSSVQGETKAAHVADQRLGTYWICSAEDRKPYVSIKMKRPVRAGRVLLSNVAPHLDGEDRPKPLVVELVLNRKRKIRTTMDQDSLRKTVIDLGGTVTIRELKVRILSAQGCELGKCALGFSEIELLPH
ncbi:MAG TPA: hypothetical protein EYQ74_15200 [Planctomycetes bacterium]|nr:hypothetical protein [Planctomycetota bacterium]